ncbi:tolA protein of Tol-Pal system [Candidatus Protochlamydia naegleriophila]|uniref:TolA protein of Tol-Pal system n=1 Tax=Candidatus Protochlamydia naegleriophila TaxID=389348 RepID=A0A0U5JG54_9BACT|nr:hypothetical protein [Candidatus Protochlamydia naegleriophila]CUI17812.1 tolA protein of Tol-Pal system [Candidatus Protochlamydia naegleriophila]
MQGYSSSFISFENRQSQQAAWWIISFAVVASHVLLLLFGAFWSAAAPKKETKRVVVTTITLNPKVQEVAQIPRSTTPPSTLPLPPAPPKEELIAKAEPLPPAPAKPILKEDIAPPLPPVLTKPVAEPLIAPASAPEPAEVPKRETKAVKPAEKKIEAKPEKKAAKPAPKTATPEPKKVAPAKKTTPAPAAKKQAEPIVKKPAKEEANKNSLAEAEKKRQKEAAAAKEAALAKEAAAHKEAERLRQQEIAAAQEVARKKQQELLAKAKENLTKAGETRNKMSAVPSLALESSSIPRQIESLQIDALPTGSTPAQLNAREISYRDEVAQRLKLNLRLPDHGSVKVKLTLDRSGKVSQVTIVASESQKNKQYIEKTLPTLFFPSFGNQFEGASQYTFLVTLNNDY